MPYSRITACQSAPIRAFAAAVSLAWIVAASASALPATPTAAADAAPTPVAKPASPPAPERPWPCAARDRVRAIAPAPAVEPTTTGELADDRFADVPIDALSAEDALAEGLRTLEIYDLPRAREAFERTLALARDAARQGDGEDGTANGELVPGSPAALEAAASLGMARLSAARFLWDDCANWIARVAELGLMDPHRFIVEARLVERQRDYEKATELLDEAIRIDPEDYRAWVSRARVRFKARDMETAVANAWYARALDPEHPYAHAMLGGGYVSIENPVDRQGFLDRAAPLAILAYDLAREDYRQGRIADARSTAALALTADPAFFGGPFLLGVIALREENTDRSTALLAEAARLAPGFPRVHNALSVALGKKRLDTYAAAAWPELAELAYNRPVPPRELVPDALDTFVVELDELPAVLRDECLRVIGPLHKWVERIVEHNVKAFEDGQENQAVVHHIMPLTHGILDVPQLSYLRDRRTFDDRLYEDVRGVGGQWACTGIEDVWSAHGMLFNTFAHEVAHQIHEYALDQWQDDVIDSLYAAAKAQREAGDVDAFLDYYAANNEHEYFAQGVEAYLSLFKRPSSGQTGRHTRFELARVDPDLYRFVDRLIDQDALARLDGWLDTLRLATTCHKRARDEANFKDAMRAYLAAYAASAPTAEPK